MTTSDKLTYIKSHHATMPSCDACNLTLGLTCPEKPWGEWTDEEIETAYAILFYHTPSYAEEQLEHAMKKDKEEREKKREATLCFQCKHVLTTVCDDCKPEYGVFPKFEEKSDEGSHSKEPEFVKVPHEEAEAETRYAQHKKLCDSLNDTYRKKNADYGDSFGKGFAEYGMMMPVIRLEDKFLRFKRLALSGEQNVKDESIKDTLLDLANYALMTIVEMEANNG